MNVNQGPAPSKKQNFTYGNTYADGKTGTTWRPPRQLPSLHRSGQRWASPLNPQRPHT